MPFAPEDVRAWENSEVMAEFEKIALHGDLLGGGPPEAHKPISERPAPEPDPAWEDEPPQRERTALPPLSHAFAMKAFAVRHEDLLEAVRNVARRLAGSGNIRGAYRTERAVADIEAIMRRNPAQGGE
jgi:hypothetical protein